MGDRVVPEGKREIGKIGVTYGFKTEEAFLEHMRLILAACYRCGHLDLKKNLREDSNAYICNDCSPV